MDVAHMNDDVPTCEGCGEEKVWVEGYNLAGEPSGYFCVNEDCGYD